jgi:hypothetical protein
LATSSNAIVYRKTSLGQAELTQRRAGLSPRARAVLVTVNGTDPAATLAERLGAEVPGALQQLLEKGLIEPLTAARAMPGAAEAEAKPEAAAPSSVGAPPATSSSPTASTLLALVKLLQPHFGHDATRVAEAALRAASQAEFNIALDGVAESLAIHMDRQAADQLLAPLRQPG